MGGESYLGRRSAHCINALIDLDRGIAEGDVNVNKCPSCDHVKILIDEYDWFTNDVFH
jgi:hypothetical protein